MTFKNSRFTLQYLYNDWRSMTAFLTLYFTKKTYVQFSYASHLCLIFINILSIFEYTWREINKRECKNSKMYIWKCKIWKCMSLQNVLKDLLQYEIYYPLPLNKTAQRNSQHCTKLHNEVQNVLHSKVYWKLEFSVCYGFVNWRKIKFTFSISLHLQDISILNWFTSSRYSSLNIQDISWDISLTW